MTIRLGLALFLLLSACSSPEQTVRAADSRLAQPTIDAALAWNAVLVLSPCPDVRLIPVGRYATADIVVTVGDSDDGRRAHFSVRANTIVVDVDRVEEYGSLDDLPTVVAHELGHALGIEQDEHSPDPGDLMHNALAPDTEPLPTANDAAWVCEKW